MATKTRASQSWKDCARRRSASSITYMNVCYKPEWLVSEGYVLKSANVAE